MRSSLRCDKSAKHYAVIMDSNVDRLRKSIWSTIHRVNDDDLRLSDCDVAMALGIVTYELIHHVNPNEPRNSE
jgi:hypothetical protein